MAEKPAEMFYFGCQRESGHYLWRSDGSEASVYTDTPWGRDIDSELVPGPQRRYIARRCVDPEHQKEGAAKLTHQHGWTAVDFWDRSVDERYGSHSVFVKAGTHSFDDMMEWAYAAFPWVFRRLDFGVILEESSGGLAGGSIP